MEIKSSAFNPELIDIKHGLYNGNISIPVSINNVNPVAKSLVIFLEDVTGGFNCLHWGIINIPVTTTEIPEGGSNTDKMPIGCKEISNDFYNRNYTGMFPPQNETHEYRLTVFALDIEQLDNSKVMFAPYYTKFKELYGQNIIEEVFTSGHYKTL